VTDRELAASHRVLSWPSGKKSDYCSLQLDHRALAEEGFQIVRQYGTDASRFEQDLDRISNGQLFYSGRIGAICHRYSVLPESANLSEQLSCGGFHTDFMFQSEPPAYIGLLCLKPDPRHPFYGRNQIVHLQRFLQRMQLLFGINEDDLKRHKLQYDLSKHGRFEQAMLDDFQGKTIFRFHELLMDKCLEQSSLVSDMSLPAALHAVLMDVAFDVSLDRGDVLIVSNHHALHRRSECSIAYDDQSGQWRTREMASIRFNL
jgi:hypothetical protein